MRTIRAIALSALLLGTTTTAAFAGDGSGFARPNLPSTEHSNGDGSGFARPNLPSTERSNGDGSGFTVPTVPGGESEYERWA